MAHFGLTILILCVGMAAPWVDAKINGIQVRPFLLASLVAVGVVPFAQWLYITPDVYRNEVTKVRVIVACVMKYAGPPVMFLSMCNSPCCAMRPGLIGRIAS